MHLELLQNTLYKFLNWHPARITTFAELIFAVIKAKTVTLKELAIHISSKGNLHAKVIKLERLFLLQDMNFTEIGKIIIKLLGLQSSVRIAIDRTNWQFGTKNLNFFVAVVVWGNISIPITWLLLDKKGNSSTDERKKLITQILNIIPHSMIEIILADREFVGEDWFK